jgi:hypothetical protein
MRKLFGNQEEGCPAKFFFFTLIQKRVNKTKEENFKMLFKTSRPISLIS